MVHKKLDKKMYFGTINVRVDMSPINRIANFSEFYNQSLRLHWHGTFFCICRSVCLSVRLQKGPLDCTSLHDSRNGVVILKLILKSGGGCNLWCVLCLSVLPSVRLSISLSVCFPSIHLPAHLSVRSVCLFVCLSIHPSVLSVCLSAYSF